MTPNHFKKKLQPLTKKTKPTDVVCKVCKEQNKKMRGKLCNECDNKKKNEAQRLKREERWKFLELDMSTKF
jgi:hypothetical protein